MTTRKRQVSAASTFDMNWYYAFAFIAWLFWMLGPDAHHTQWEVMTFGFVILGRIERSDLRTRQVVLGNQGGKR